VVTPVMRLPPVPEEVAMSAQPRPWRGVGDELDAAVRNYATRAVRTQMWLRLLLVAFVAATVLFALLVAAVWVVTAPFTHERRMYEGIAAVAQGLLPPLGAPPATWTGVE
jgi:hypothetical protein